MTLAEAIENIDIGGPSMLRSAAKNHESVTVVMDPSDYAEVAAQITAGGNTTPELRRRLAARAFARTAAYDGQIAGYLAKVFGLGAADGARGAGTEMGRDGTAWRRGSRGRRGCAWTCRGRRNCATGRTRTSGRRCTGGLGSFSSNCTGGSCPITIYWT